MNAMLDPDAPLRLNHAAKLAFPDGALTESGLQTEFRKGNLECERIAGKLFTTLNNIKRMRDKCRESQKARGSTCASEAGGRLYGSFSTEQLRSAQDAASTIAARLKSSSKNT